MPVVSADQRQAFHAIEAAARKANMRAFVVGGIVRDLLSARGIQNQDIDFLIEGNAIEFAESLAAEIGGTVKKFADFVTAKIVAPEKLHSIHELDFASARTEKYNVPGALPTVSLSTVEEDLKRRDFSINAMALPVGALLQASSAAHKDLVSILQPAVLDYFKGLDHLAAKKIEVLHDASFIDDPTRIFRAARYAVRIDGQLGSHTRDLVSQALEKGALATISEQRKINEVKKILAEARWLSVIEFLQDWGVLSHLEILSAVPLQKLMQALGALSLPGFKAAKIDRVAVFLAAAGILSSQENTANSFSKIGVSRKRIQEFSVAREWGVSAPVTKAVIAKASDAVLVAASLLSSDPAWEEVLRERGLRERV